MLFNTPHVDAFFFAGQPCSALTHIVEKLYQSRVGVCVRVTIRIKVTVIGLQVRVKVTVIGLQVRVNVTVRG